MNINKVTLYHGSYSIVEKLDLKFCNKFKDFGKGFYLTTDINQAKNFIQTSIKKAFNRGIIPSEIQSGYISNFEFTPDESLSVFSFKEANSSWLHCVASHRNSNCFPQERNRWKGYDLICGKIANDKTNTVISAYIDGLYGPTESDRATEIAIGLLEPEKLVDQWCFRSDKAIAALKFIGADKA